MSASATLAGTGYRGIRVRGVISEASAVIDRVVHDAYMVVLKCDSYRRKERGSRTTLWPRVRLSWP